MLFCLAFAKQLTNLQKFCFYIFVSMIRKHVYMMPGMAASPKIFEFLEFPHTIEVHWLSWVPPFENESLQAYANRMCQRVKHPNPILLGVSFGGILVQEMAQLITVEKVIIISSVKAREELPLHMRMAKSTQLHKLLPLQWVENIETLALFAFGNAIKRRLSMYRRYLSERDVGYLRWSINQIVNWNPTGQIAELIHIHGKEDSVFPIKGIQAPVRVIAGEHAMIITKKNWFNTHLPAIILGEEKQEKQEKIVTTKIP